jgi:hypothetical protein
MNKRTFSACLISSCLTFGCNITVTEPSLDVDPDNPIAESDVDSDGIVDSKDLCPGSNGNVNEDGCSQDQLDEINANMDSDGDGISDVVDQCLNTPAGDQVDAEGCTIVIDLDSDNDGVKDTADQCPNTPAGTEVDEDGCPIEQNNPSIPEAGEHPGLLYGEVAGAMNETAANPNWERTTDLNQTENLIKGNTTEIYSGFIYDEDGHISFYENMDDSVRVYIDGNVVLSDDEWSSASQTADLALTPGIHAFELRIGNADGGSGPVDGIGFGIDVDGGTNFVHPSQLAQSIFSSNGEESGNPDAPQEGDIVIELENFIRTGTVGRVGGDQIEGFNATATSVNWVTNGDWGEYEVTFVESGTYKAYFTMSAENVGSYGARVDMDNEPVAWGYFSETGSWDVAKEELLYGGHFVVNQPGNATIRVEAIGGSDWQWSGDKVRFTRVGDVTNPPETPYQPGDHVVSEIEGPKLTLTHLKPPVALPEDNKVIKSDVWYTYPQNREMDGFADFGATGSFWGHPPEQDFYDDMVIMDWAVNVVDDFQKEGFEYTARGEFDWGYGWFTEFVTNPQPHYVRTLDDRNVRMTFMGYLSHNGYNNNWLSNHSPAFVPFMKSQVDQILKANPHKLMFDSQTSSTRSTDMRTFGGDFSTYAMENFRTWLAKKYDATELSQLGINNINTFDYKTFLLANGVTHESFTAAADTLSGNVPLLEDFIYFNRDVWNQKFGEVLDYIRQVQPNIEIGASTHLFESRGYLFNENITFLANELNLGARTTISELPTNIIVHLKGADAVDKTLAYFPYPWEFAELQAKDAPRFGRGWVAQAYAYGGIFSIPANVWIGGAGVWSPGADNYRDIYQFVRNNEHLIDDYKTYSKVGLVHAMYSSMKAGFIDGGNQIQSSVKLLTLDNINFDLLIFGDEGYPVIPRDEEFDNYEHIFYDGDLQYLTPEQRAVLDKQGQKVRHIGQRGTIDGLDISVSHNGSVANETVTAVSRVHETNADAPYVVHLINRPFENGRTPTLDGVEITIPGDYFPETLTSVKLHLPDGTSTNLSMTNNSSGDVAVVVNNLEVWGLLELVH